MNPRLSARLGRLTPIAAILTVLLAEHVWMFGDFYRGVVSFPFDFPATYHAMTFYWQGLAGIGHFAEWIPFQSFGYPFPLSLQSGMFYPPLWLFVVFRVVYSVHVAAVFECLHILAGALGMVWLARVWRLPWAVAAIAGVAYQLFGGFFCNAEHVDIVRGYALTPWLLAALTFSPEERWDRPAARTLALPFIVLCFLTGAYPGQIPPTLLFAGAYLLLQVKERGREHALPRIAWRGLMLLLGLLMALPNLGPGWLLRSQVARTSTDHLVAGMQLNHLFTTLFRYDARAVAGDPAMNSFFLTVPIAVGLFFCGRAQVWRLRSLIVVSLLALLMLPAGAVFHLAIRLCPPLALSRFPSADYRALLAVPLTLLGAVGLARLLERQPRSPWWAFKALALLGFVAYAGHRFDWSHLSTYEIGTLALVLALLGVIVLFAQMTAAPRPLLVAALLLVTIFDGHRMQFLVPQLWRGAPDASTYVAALHQLQRSIKTPLQRRPARVAGGWAFDHHWPPHLGGYLSGQWMADDYAASEHLHVIATLRRDPALVSYMMRAGEPKLVSTTASARAAFEAPAIGQVLPVDYRPELIRYRVRAPAASVLVENEPAFPGWRATASCDPGGRPIVLTPATAAWPLRAWQVPAGDFLVEERFRLPGLRGCALGALGGLLVWLLLLGRRLLQRDAASTRARSYAPVTSTTTPATVMVTAQKRGRLHGSWR